MDDILLKVYSDLGDVLKNVEISKRNLVIRMAKEISKDETLDAKRLQIIDKAYVTIKKMGNDLMRTGKMLTAYELLEVDKQLAEEALQQEKLDIERSKLKTDINEDNKIEIKLVGI